MSCAFCGESFSVENPRSKEHAWALWLASILPQHSEPFRHQAVSPKGKVLSEWVADDLAVITKRVCDRCNTGWMHELERIARSYLTSVVKANGRTLYREGQTALAAWAVKTALALNLATQGAREIDRRHYREMVESAVQPPPNTIVWLGSYRGYRHLYFHPTHLQLTPRRWQVPGRGPDAEGFFATIVVGSAVFQVFGHTYQEELHVVPFGGGNDVAPQIWPIDRLELGYPSGPAITEETLSAFATRQATGRAID